MSTSDTLPSSKNLEKQEKSRIRLAYLDGIRGIAALYIVLFHVFQECTTGKEISPLVLSAAKWMGYGKDGIAVFIVLSGYCLMLPVVQSGTLQLRGGWLNYLKQRAWRILPTYYAALLLSLLLLALTLSWQYFTGFHWDVSEGFKPGTLPQPGAIISHFLLVHNLNLDWAYAINDPMWYMATQWQIYLLFPILLLPVYRNFGIIALVVIAFVIGEAPTHVWPEWHHWTLEPWLLGIFTLGMAGALINFSQKHSIIRWKNRIPWGLLTATLWIGLIAMVAPSPAPLGVSQKFAYLIGAATASLLIYCTHSLTTANATRRPFIWQLLETRYLVALGTFSYSLYLTHAPVVVLVHQFLLRLQMSPTLTFLTSLIVAVPLSMIISYVFYLNFEKPFMSSHSKRRRALSF